MQGAHVYQCIVWRLTNRPTSALQRNYSPPPCQDCAYSSATLQYKTTDKVTPMSMKHTIKAYNRNTNTSVTAVFWVSTPCSKGLFQQFSLLHRACCFDYFFNIPTHAPIIYTLKSTKFTLKHLKTLKIWGKF